jgi:hypothetical protein
MSNGISLSGGHLDIGPDGHGHFQATIPSLSDFKGVVAYLNADAVLYTPTDGKPHKLQLTDPDPAPPPTFPAAATLVPLTTERIVRWVLAEYRGISDLVPSSCSRRGFRDR